MIRIPKDTPTENRSKLSKDELKHFRMLETQFRQREQENKKVRAKLARDTEVMNQMISEAIRKAIKRMR